MRKMLLASAAVLVLAGSTAVYAQHRPWWFHHHARINPEDRAAFADARIAAVKAGLKLTPDQEKLWPPVEAAVRDFAKLRIDRANARMNPSRDDAQKPDDPVMRLRDRAETLGTTAAALKRIADAADPLYKTLDEAQKRRLAVLTRMGGGRMGDEGWRHRRFERDFDRDGDRDQGRDSGRDRGGPDRGFGRDHGGGPDRL
jgi:hypothetical protein